MSVYNVKKPTDAEVTAWFTDPYRGGITRGVPHPWRQAYARSKVLINIRIAIHKASTLEELKERMADLTNVLLDMTKP